MRNDGDASMFGFAKHDSLEWKKLDSLDDVRSRTDFEVLGLLGEGGFGKAYKVRNKLDSKLYAMKKVPLPPASEDQDLKRVMREVQLLSGLESPRVVRYYSAWTENGVEEEDGDDRDSFAYSTNERIGLSGFSSRSDLSKRFNDSAHPFASRSSGQTKMNIPSSSKGPKCNLCNSSYIDWEVAFEQWGLLDAVLHPLDLCTDCYFRSLPSNIDLSKIQIRQQQTFSRYLFILMELCDSTLTEAIEENQIRQKDQSGCDRRWSLFGQCVEGVAYLHQQGVIHRDLKPTNVFIHQNEVKIGDLGLARMVSPHRKDHGALDDEAVGVQTDGQHLQQSVTPVKASKPLHEEKSSRIGTFLYTALEVSTGDYNEACDIYSLGVLLVEMFSNFSTGMERAQVLGSLRKGCEESSQKKDGDDFLSDFRRDHPIPAKLATQMTQLDPSKRPTCADILEFMNDHSVWDSATRPTTPRNDSQTSDDPSRGQSGQATTNIGDFELQELKEKLENANKTIENLRLLLDQHKISHKHIL